MADLRRPTYKYNWLIAGTDSCIQISCSDSDFQGDNDDDDDDEGEFTAVIMLGKKKNPFLAFPQKPLDRM